MPKLKDELIIDDNFKVKIDSMNLTLLKRCKKKDKDKEDFSWIVLGNFNPESPDNLLHYLISHKLIEKGFGDLETYVKATQELHTYVDTVIREVAPELVKSLEK